MITFTVQQVNELLQALGQLPYVYSKPLIDGINAIAQAQVKSVATEQQLDKETIVEPDISLS
jgi:hypothetical protein